MKLIGLALIITSIVALEVQHGIPAAIRRKLGHLPKDNSTMFLQQAGMDMKTLLLGLKEGKIDVSLRDTLLNILNEAAATNDAKQTKLDSEDEDIQAIKDFILARSHANDATTTEAATTEAATTAAAGPVTPYKYYGCYQDCGTTRKATFGSTVSGNRVCDDKQKNVQDPAKCAPWCAGMGYKMFGLACPTGASNMECWCCNLPLDASNARILDYECNNGPIHLVGAKGYDINAQGFSGISTGCQLSQEPRHMKNGFWLGGHCRAAIYFA